MISLLRAALLLLAVVSATPSIAALQSPFADLSPAASSYRKTHPCPPAPPPVRGLSGIPYYVDARHSIADPARREANRRLQKPAVTFVDHVSGWADSWRRSLGRDAGSARCAAAWLDAWATGDAFRSTDNVSGGYRRSWHVSGLALAWLKVRGAEVIAPDRARRIDAWMARQGWLIARFYAEPRRARDARNNHGAWAALAAGAAAIAAGDEALFAWAESRFRANLAEVTEAGDLPLETARGKRALHYHLFALTPLTLMARLERANGRPFDTAALDRLEAFVRAEVEQPGILEHLAGERQELPGPAGDPAALVWAAVSATRPQAKLRHLLEARTPLRDPRSGGDVRLTWTVRPEAAR